MKLFPRATEGNVRKLDILFLEATLKGTPLWVAVDYDVMEHILLSAEKVLTQLEREKRKK